MWVRDLVNPMSTRASTWWCESAFRSLLMGHGFHRMQRPHAPRSPEPSDGFVPSRPVDVAETRPPSSRRSRGQAGEDL